MPMIYCFRKQQIPFQESKMAAKIQDGRQYLENRLVQCVQTIEICEFIDKYGTRNAPDIIF